MPYSEEQIHTLEIINYVCESLSLVGSLVIIISYCIYKRLRDNFAYSLVFYLAIANLTKSTAKIGGSFLSDKSSDRGMCVFMGFLVNVGGFSSFLLVACIAFVMYAIVKIKWASFWSDSEKLNKRKQYIAIVIFSVGILVSCFPFTQNAYSYVGAWCWIGNKTHHWRWICYYVPLILSFFFCVVIYCIILHDIRELEKKMNDQHTSKFRIFRKLKYYPMILLIAYLFPTIRRFVNIFQDEAPFWLGVCHTLGSGSFGLLIAIVYGINQNVKRQYKKSLEGTIRSHEMKVVQSIDIDSTAGKYDKSIGSEAEAA